MPILIGMPFSGRKIKMVRSMFKSFLLVVLVLAITPATVLCAGSNATAGSISGRVVVSGTGETLPGSNVIVRSQQGEFLSGQSTDSNGKFQFKDLLPGVYVVEVTFIGYGAESKQVEVIAKQNTEITFAMKEAALISDPLIVTAGRRAEKVSEASANIQIVEPKAIEMSQEPTVFGMMKSVPGIDYFETGMGQQQINARGFYSPFTGNMLVLVDYRVTTLPGIGGNFGPLMGTSKEDIKHVEVIVGPNSALYGANASQGVVNIITKDPRESAGHSVTFAAGNRSMFRVAARSSAVINSKFAYKIAAERYTANDFESYVNPLTDSSTTKEDPLSDDPNFNIKNWVANGSLYYYPSASTRISYTGGFANANFVNQSNIGRLQVKDFRLWYHQVRVNFDQFFGLGSLFVQGYYTADDAGDTYSLEDRKALELDGRLDEATIKKLTTFVDKPKRYDLELQHNFSIGSKNFITWGAQYRDIRPNSEGTFLSDGPKGEKIKIKETALYAQYENEMLPNTRLTLTGRYDNNDTFGSQFSPKAAIQYRFKGHNFRFSYNKGFASPPIQPAFALSFLGMHPSGLQMWLRGAHAGFSLLNIHDGSTSKIEALKPVISRGFELGYKGTFADRLLIDITAYTTKYKDFISSPILINNPAAGIFVLDENGQPRTEITLSYINFGEVQIRGLDAGAEYLVNNHFSLRGAVSLLHFGDFKNVPAQVPGSPSHNAPETTAKGGIVFTDWLKPGSRAQLALRHVESYTFIGAQPYNRGTVPTYTVVDLDLDVPVTLGSTLNANVGVNVKNLFDNKHIELPGAAELGLLVNGYVTFRL